MKFEDKEVKQLECTNVDDIVMLIVEYLCGQKYYKKLIKDDKRLIENLIGKAKVEGLNHEQFNELLLLLMQDRVGEDFFEFFFEKKDGISLDDLKNAVVKFRGFAMLCFGNFRFAYKRLIHESKEKLREKLEPYWKEKIKCTNKFRKRPPKMLEIEKIKGDKTWYIGELTGLVIKKNLEKLKTWTPPQEIKADFVKFEEQLLRMSKEREEANRKAQKNTEIYLTWDYMDVYIATSMRHKWEFDETFNFIEEVLSDPSLKDLNLRYFDPTQSKCSNPRDKGLIEGLMLKRASSTIYMAQESDTMGKDSELAATLAQSTPVIAYVPKIKPKKYSKKIEEYPLDFFKKRLLILNAEGIFDDEKCLKELRNYDKNFEKTIDNFLRKLEKHHKSQPFSLWFDMDNKKFKQKFDDFSKVCYILAIAESCNFDGRADLLRGKHPLSMQVDLQTGVANGVLVVRTTKKCTELLRKILTNSMEFTITHEEEPNGGVTILKEKVSESPFRVVTDYERLTNSFWNFFS